MNAPHPDLDELADLAAELLPPNRAAELEAHLDGCPDCTQQLTTVSAVPALLADIPAPAIPAEVAARLDSVLQDEAERRTADTDADRAGGPVPPTPIAQRRATGTWGERHPRLRLAAAAAATVAVLGGGVTLIGSQGLSTGGSAESTSAEDAGGSDSSGGEAARGQSGVAPTREQAFAAELDGLARRLKARQDEDGVGVSPPVTAAAAAVHGLRVGMADS